MKKLSCSIIIFLTLQHGLFDQSFVTEKNEKGAFPIVTAAHATSIYVDENDDWLVHKAASLLQNDIEMATGKKPEIVSSLPSAKNVMVIGSLKPGASTNYS